MTPWWLPVLLGSVEAATFWWLRRRIAYRRYPALMAYLVSEAVWHIAGAWHYPIGTRWAQPLRMALRAWVVVEVFRFACVRFSAAQRARLAGEALTISGTAAWGTLMCTRLSPLENWFVFRGYYHLILAAALWWLVVRMRWAPVAENRDHRCYRWGMTRWLSIVALDGMFVRGAAGYWIFPWTDRGAAC